MIVVFVAAAAAAIIRNLMFQEYHQAGPNPSWIKHRLIYNSNGLPVLIYSILS